MNDDSSSWEYKPDGQNVSQPPELSTSGAKGRSSPKLASGVIAIVGMIVGVFSTHKPKQVSYELSSSGLKAGEKVYPLSLFRSFALIREGVLSSVNLIPIKRFVPPLSIYFDPSDEQKIISVLGEHLPLEEGGLDPIERLSRRLRF